MDFGDTVLIAELEGKLSLYKWSLSHNFPSSCYFHKIFSMHFQKSSVYLCTKKFPFTLLFVALVGLDFFKESQSF